MWLQAVRNPRALKSFHIVRCKDTKKYKRGQTPIVLFSKMIQLGSVPFCTFLECAVFAAVVKLLLQVVVVVDHLVIYNVAVFLYGNDVGIDKAAVGFQV